MVDCTPDFPAQLRMLEQLLPAGDGTPLSGILLTHAHIGHYAGLIHLGREALDTRAMPVYAMPRMRRLLEHDAPWSPLVDGGHVELRNLADGAAVSLNERISLTPLLVPHRDELSETVGFRIEGPSRSALYLPDIDKWERWETRIEEVISGVDVAYLDGTFFADGELGNRRIADVPHPLVGGSIDRFAALPAADRGKIRFIHFNHTNPLLNPSSQATASVIRAGCRVSVEGEQFGL